MPRMLFEKTGDSIWISHLDLMRVFQRAFRRADLLLKHSQGFTPRAIVSIALPLSVGVESRCELLDFELEDGSCPTPEQINEKLPDGIRVLEIYPDVRRIKELTYLRAELKLTYDGGVPADAIDGIRDLLSRKTLVMEKHSRRGSGEVDLLPMLRDYELKQINEKTLCWKVLVCAQNPSLNPLLLVSAVEWYTPQWKPDGVFCCREEIYDAAGNIFR